MKSSCPHLCLLLLLPALAVTDLRAEEKEKKTWQQRVEHGRSLREKDLIWEAKQVLEDCLAEAQEYPRKDPRRILICMELGESYLGLNLPEKALPLFDEAAGIVEFNHGDEHPGLVAPLLEVAKATSHLSKGDWHAPLEKATALSEKQHPPNGPERLRTLCLALEICQSRGDYRGAESYARKALLLLGGEQGLKAGILRLLKGDLPEAAKPLPTALVLAPSTLLFFALARQGKFAEVEELHRQVDSLLSADKRLRADLELVLGEALTAGGAEDRALIFYQASLRDYQETPGPLPGEVARRQLLTAHCQFALGQLNEAAALYEAALPGLAATPPRQQEGLHGLLRIHTQRANLPEAAKAALRIFEISKRTAGSLSEATAQDASRAGDLLLRAGLRTQAAPLYAQALAATEELFDPQSSPALAARIRTLCGTCLEKKERDVLPRLLPLLKRLEQVQQAILPALSDEQRELWFQDYPPVWNLLLTTLLATAPESQPALAALHQTALNLTGTALDLSPPEACPEAQPESDERKARRLDLTALRRQLAQRHLGHLPAPGQEESLSDLESRLEGLENALAKDSPRLAAALRARKAGLEELQGALPAEAILVHLLRVEMLPPGPAPGIAQNHWVAMLATRETLSPMLDLGPAAAIETTAAQAWGLLAATPERLSANGEAKAGEELQQVLSRLGRLVLGPAWTRLKEKRRWILAQDARLPLLPLNLLPLPDDPSRLVLDAFEVSTRSHPREAPAGSARELSGRALILAGAEAETPKATAGGEGAGPAPRPPFWPGLPGGRLEAEVVAQGLQGGPLEVLAKTGPRADKGLLLETQAPRILHLAVHAFFLPEEWGAGPGGRAAEAGLPSGAAGLRDLFRSFAGVGRRLGDPRLRAGLLLAEGERQDPVASAVAARELEGLTLAGTELAVLSNCDSGRGSLRCSQGLAALRRSFLQAGSRTLVYSLWLMPDEERSALLADFYGRRLAGTSSSASLRQAMLAAREKRKARLGAAHPYFWGGFMLAGEPE